MHKANDTPEKKSSYHNWESNPGFFLIRALLCTSCSVCNMSNPNSREKSAAVVV